MELGVSHMLNLSSLTPIVDNIFDKYNNKKFGTHKIFFQIMTFRRVAQEIGYNADLQLTFFRCSVPPHLYFYLKDATTLKDAMENIKRACALGGVSVQGTPAQVETNVTPPVPFMIMNDRQERHPLKTVSFKEESSQDKVNESILKLTQMMERQFQLAEKQDSDSRSRSRRKDRRNSRDRRP